MTNGKIGVTTENIFPVIKKFLYSDHEIFLRELSPTPSTPRRNSRRWLRAARCRESWAI